MENAQPAGNDRRGAAAPWTTGAGAFALASLHHHHLTTHPLALRRKCTQRPRRLGAQLIHVPPPDFAHRRAVLAVHVARLPVAALLNLDELAARTERFSCAALAALVREASLRALARHLPGSDTDTAALKEGWRSAASDWEEATGAAESGQHSAGGGGKPVVTLLDFEHALRFVQRTQHSATVSDSAMCDDGSLIL